MGSPPREEDKPIAQCRHAFAHIGAAARPQVTLGVLGGHQRVDGVMTIEDGQDEGVDSVAPDDRLSQKAFGADDQQILPQ